MFPSTLPFARRLNISHPVISYQGGMVRAIEPELENIYDYPILFNEPIPMEAASGVLDMIEANDWQANLYVNDHLYVNKMTYETQHYQMISGVAPEVVPDLKSMLTVPPSKMMIIDAHANTIVDKLKSAFPNQINSCLSRFNYCEVVNPEVSKWRAIEFLMAHWGIAAEEVMAIGDQENDLSMIEGAGLGVAMGNAPAHVKAQANYVTDTIEHDGAANAMLKWAL
jgi:Cof subfamily protein (haloacid dehalogenase superfamily)